MVCSKLSDLEADTSFELFITHIGILVPNRLVVG